MSVASTSRGRVRCRSASQQEQVEIENLTEDFCDDFVCKSSPAVEQSVRKLGNNILQLSYSKRQFAPKVKYSDGFRTFQGSVNYDRMNFLREYFEGSKCKVGVTKMEMIDLDTSVIEWTLSGEQSLGTIDLEGRSTFEMNVITGKVEDHKEEWKVTSFTPAALAFTLNRIKWSLIENFKDQGDKMKESFEKSAEESEEDQYFVDPMNPNKYIQQQDTTFNDALQLGIVLALLYSVVQILIAAEGGL